MKWLALVLERMNLNQYSESSAQPGLSAIKLKVLPVLVPPLGEQQAIALLIRKLVFELSSLNNRLAKTRQLKQGMIQQLLTGKIRLVKPSTVSAS
jgi:type I restriction enzyme S subunit